MIGIEQFGTRQLHGIYTFTCKHVKIFLFDFGSSHFFCSRKPLSLLSFLFIFSSWWIAGWWFLILQFTLSQKEMLSDDDRGVTLYCTLLLQAGWSSGWSVLWRALMYSICIQNNLFEWKINPEQGYFFYVWIGSIGIHMNIFERR